MWKRAPWSRLKKRFIAMKSITIAGIVLIALGVAGFAVGNVSFTTKEKAVEIGPIQVITDKKHDVAAIIVVAAGAALVFVGLRKT